MAQEQEKTSAVPKAIVPAAGPAAAGAKPAPVRKVEAMVARGLGPPDIAEVLVENLADRDAILMYLHQTCGNAFVEKVLAFGSSKPAGNANANATPVVQRDPLPDADPLVGGKAMLAFVVPARGQQVQVYISPGGINTKPDVFMFFHGQRANLKIDDTIKA